MFLSKRENEPSADMGGELPVQYLEISEIFFRIEGLTHFVLALERVAYDNLNYSFRHLIYVSNIILHFHQLILN